MRYVARSIKNFPEKSWTSVELYEIYLKNGGIESNRSRFLTDLTNCMGDEFCTSRGISSIVVLRQKASSLFQIVPEDDHDDINSSIN